MWDLLFWHRLQFAFTATYHDLSPQLTIDLAFVILLLKALGLRTGEARYNDAVRIWVRIFGIRLAPPWPVGMSFPLTLFRFHRGK